MRLDTGRKMRVLGAMVVCGEEALYTIHCAGEPHLQSPHRDGRRAPKVR